METNIGSIDQGLRIVGLIITAYLYIAETFTGFAGTATGILAIYCFVTALTRYSPIWEMLGISTEKSFHKVVHE